MHGTTLIKAAALAITLALVAVPAWAGVVVVEVGVDGACAGADLITSTALDTLAGVTVNIPATGSPWNCVANCYIQADQPAGGGVHGQLVLMVGGVVVPFTARNFELTDEPAPDDGEDFIEVSTGAITPPLAAGPNIIQCAASQLFAFEPDFLVAASCIKVVCADRRL